MDEKQLGKMLLEHGDIRAVNDPVAVAHQIAGRDRSRLRRFAGILLVLWIAVIGLGSWTTGYFVAEHMEDVVRDVEQIVEDLVAANQLKMTPGRQKTLANLKDSYQHDAAESLLDLGAVTGMTLLAVALTLMYIGFSRRATLRQINANLLDISEQLRRLQKT